jgi:predicted enzyme related to lactoylglutathione lyase
MADNGGMADPTARGRFFWHEMMSPDPKASTAFYEKLIGWSPNPWDQDPSYTFLSMGGKSMGGVMTLPDEAKAMGTPPQWVCYIGTPDVDALARQVPGLGGQVHKPPRDIPTIGRFAIIGDPQGAIFAAFTPTKTPPLDTKIAIGDFSWHELITTDWESAWKFYEALFEWQKMDAMDMGPDGKYQMYGLKDHMLGGMFNRPKGNPVPATWLPYILVPDSPALVKTIEQLGGKVIHGPMEVPGGDWIVQGLDPQGAMFALHSKKKAA